MKQSSDPLIYREYEQRMIRHVESLLDDERLRIDTTVGRRPAKIFDRQVVQADRGVDLKREMAEAGLPDRELEGRMPAGQTLEVTLSRSKWFFRREIVGRVRVICVSPTKQLLRGQADGSGGAEIMPLGSAEVNHILGQLPPSLGGVPTTLVLVSTSGFEMNTHELAERRPERMLILAEPNDAGGWSITAPPEIQPLEELLNPEDEGEKRHRIREALDEKESDLGGSGVAADRLAAETKLALSTIEAELKAYAKEHPGLIAKRLDGRLVLFREGTMISPEAGGRGMLGGGSEMAIIDRVRSLFSRKGETAKKIAFLSERRAALSQQRDRAYEDMGTIEKQDETLRQQFKESTGTITRKRITSQLVQLRRDVERRQQLLGVLNQQINVVSTHLHNLELVQQGQTANLPDAEELTGDAVKAEEMLAQLEADNEVASSVGMVSAALSEEEATLYAELERESGGTEASAPGSKQMPPAEVRTSPIAKEGGAAARPDRGRPEAG